jgi:hypothetical protein
MRQMTNKREKENASTLGVTDALSTASSWECARESMEARYWWFNKWNGEWRSQSMHRRWQSSTLTAGENNKHVKYKYTLNHSHNPACTAFSKRTSHITSKNSSETWIVCESHNSHDHKIKITCIEHMRRVHAYSQDASVCTCIDAVNGQGNVIEAQSRKEENRFDWLILVRDVQPWLLSHLQWHQASKGLHHWWDVSACIGITSHTLTPGWSWVLGWIVLWNELFAATLFRAQVKNKNAGISMVRLLNLLVSYRRQ